MYAKIKIASMLENGGNNYPTKKKGGIDWKHYVIFKQPAHTAVFYNSWQVLFITEYKMSFCLHLGLLNALQSK